MKKLTHDDKSILMQNEKEYMKQYNRIYYEKNIEKLNERSKIYYRLKKGK